jgi:hypothetical protein
MKKIITILAGILAGLAGVGWLGLQIKPKPLLPYPERTPDLEDVELPVDLPTPVRRFFQTIAGNGVPRIESAVLTGRARLRVFGLRFPSRFRIVHDAGQGYRHYLEATIFGIPIMKVDECYLDGKARMELPFGVIENDPKTDSAANLGLWAESLWLPSILVTDPRVRWEAIDDTTARLVVPLDQEEDSFTVSFDPQTGLLQRMEAMRWKNSESEAKVLWRNESLGWQTAHGIQIPSPATATWMDEGTPWSEWSMEDVVYNVDVTDYIRARGP